MVLIPVSCTILWTSVHSSSGTLSIRYSPLNLFLTFTVSGQVRSVAQSCPTLCDPINHSSPGLPVHHQLLEFVITEWSSGFPYFLQYKSEFLNKEFMICVTVSAWCSFCWLYRASPFLAAMNIINLISVLTIWWCPCVESSLVLLEKGVFYDQCILLAKLC